MDTDTRTGLDVAHLKQSGEWTDWICKEVQTWRGTPYVPMGRVKGVGVDCGGLVYEVYNPIFGPFPAYPRYAPDWAMHKNDEVYLAFIMPFIEEVREVERGGLTLFHLGLAYSHAGIYVGNGNYVHAWGRQRAGSVTQTPIRMMKWMCKNNMKHFMPRI